MTEAQSAAKPLTAEQWAEMREAARDAYRRIASEMTVGAMEKGTHGATWELNYLRQDIEAFDEKVGGLTSS